MDHSTRHFAHKNKAQRPSMDSNEIFLSSGSQDMEAEIVLGGDVPAAPLGGPVDPEQTQLIGGSPQPAPAAPLAHNPTAPLNPVEDPLMVDWETQGTQSFDHDLAPTIIEQPDGNMEDNFVAFEEPYADQGSNDFFSDEPDEYSDRQSRRSTRSSRTSRRTTVRQADGDDSMLAAPAGKRRGSRSDGRMRRRSDGRMPNRRSGGRSRAEEKRHRSGTGSAFSVQAVIRALCVIVVIGVTIWFFIVLTRPDKDFLRGQQIVGRVDGMIGVMEAHLKTRHTRVVNEAGARALGMLDSAVVGFARGEESFDHEQYAGPALGRIAADQKIRIGVILAEVPKAESERLAKANAGFLLLRLQRVTSENDLDDLESDSAAYLRNPVAPHLNEELPSGAYSVYREQVRRLLPKIAQERERRYRIEAGRALAELDAEIAKTINSKQYGVAMQQLQNTRENYPDVDVSLQEERILDAANRTWTIARRIAAGAYEASQTAGYTKATRDEQYRTMQKTLRFVVDNYGLPEYVDQARDLLANPALLNN